MDNRKVIRIKSAGIFPGCVDLSQWKPGDALLWGRGFALVSTEGKTMNTFKMNKDSL